MYDLDHSAQLGNVSVMLQPCSLTLPAVEGRAPLEISLPTSCHQTPLRAVHDTGRTVGLLSEIFLLQTSRREESWSAFYLSVPAGRNPASEQSLD